MCLEKFIKFITCILLALFLQGFSFVAFAQDVADDVWVAEEIKGVGIIASVNGRITHGDRYQIKIENNECKQGEAFFTLYTMENNKDILKLDGKKIKIKFNNKIAHAEILYPQDILMGYSVIIYLGFNPIESIINYHKDRERISVELIDGEGFKASDYFDVLKNEWSLTGFESSLIQAQSLCKEKNKMVPRQNLMDQKD